MEKKKGDKRRIKRVTVYCPIEGDSLTQIYKRTCFGWKKIIQYRLVLTKFQTIGTGEWGLGRASVPKKYGDTFYKYIFKRDKI